MKTINWKKQDWEYINQFEVWSTHANNPNYLSALERKKSSHFMSVDFLHLKDYELLQKSLKTVEYSLLRRNFRYGQ